MISPRHDTPRHHITAIVRDVIEVVAILAAGIWAIYTFIYEERIKPAAEPPAIVVSAALERLGEHNGLVQIGYSGTIRNIGHTRICIIAEGYSASGVRYAALQRPLTTVKWSGSTIDYDRDAHVSAQVLVHRTYQLTRFVKPAYGGGYEIDPNEQLPISGQFAVRKNDFDAVVLYGSVAFARFDGYRTYAMHVGFTGEGAPIFNQRNDDFSAIEVTLGRLSLW